jgi:hypothetical protein
VAAGELAAYVANEPETFYNATTGHVSSDAPAKDD